MSVIADPKAIAARRNAQKVTSEQQRQNAFLAQRKRQQEAQAKAFRKAHGLVD